MAVYILPQAPPFFSKPISLIKMRSTCLLLIGVALLLITTAPVARSQYETENEDEFSYVPGAKNGPGNWSNIKPAEWGNCSVGRMQSPINLALERVTVMPSLGYLDVSYRPAQANIINRGHDIQVKFRGDAGRVVINGTVYFLRQLHWHTPSEHTINSRRYDMELHLVHQDAQDKAAVIAILYQMGGHDTFLQRLEPSITKIAGNKDKNGIPIGVVDPPQVASKGEDTVYYRYMGSLTTPPCTEGVIWTIVQRIRTVSRYQINLLREAVDDGNENNARPLQEMNNNRSIGLFVPVPIKQD